MEQIRACAGRLCGKLPGTTGLAGYVLCCVLPCRGCLRLVQGRGQRGGQEEAKTSPLLQSKATRKVLILGLDGSGKSAFLWFCGHPKQEVLPQGKLTKTSGVQRLTRKGLEHQGRFVDLDLSEVGGSVEIRPFWRRYMSQDIAVVAFFVDASDPERFAEAVPQFAVACGAAAASAPRAHLLLVASRTEQPGALTAAEVHGAIRSGAAGVPLDFSRVSGAELVLSGHDARASVDQLQHLFAMLALAA